MNEILYGVNSLLIAGFLFITMAVAIETGYRIGRTQEGFFNAATREHINAIQTSLLGVMALVLAFSFSLALQRSDSRNAALVDEANAIGTTYLRAQLLPLSVRTDAQNLLQRYIDLRVQESGATLDREPHRNQLLLKANQVLDGIWGCARRAAEEDPNPVTTGLFIQSLNETMDAFGRREAVLRRHVPEVILFLLFGSFVMTCGVVGYSSGVAGHRPAWVSYILVALIVVLAYIVVDLDRPRRGMIKVDRTSLLQLKAAIDEAQSAEVEPQVPAEGATDRH